MRLGARPCLPHGLISSHFFNSLLLACGLVWITLFFWLMCGFGQVNQTWIICPNFFLQLLRPLDYDCPRYHDLKHQSHKDQEYKKVEAENKVQFTLAVTEGKAFHLSAFTLSHVTIRPHPRPSPPHPRHITHLTLPLPTPPHPWPTRCTPHAPPHPQHLTQTS